MLAVHQDSKTSEVHSPFDSLPGWASEENYETFVNKSNKYIVLLVFI